MHSSILSKVMNTIWDWFMNFPYPWDNNTFTMFDYFKFCCIVYCIFYFIYHILLGFIREKQYESFVDEYLDEGYTLEGAMDMARDDIYG